MLNGFDCATAGAEVAALDVHLVDDEAASAEFADFVVGLLVLGRATG